MREQYIPDLTERFPEGFDGVDMTPSYFGEPVDWNRAVGYDDVDYCDDCQDYEKYGENACERCSKF